ncbi:MAG: hypothetical protein ISR44_01485 [Rhodospirillales bacterium]|nr:hypothetical protein [Rhodospirillales bacterium]
MQSSHYTWRTVQDGKVRSSHADREGKVFLWTKPPKGGHPGEDFNCRCWAEQNVAEADKCYYKRLDKEEAQRKYEDHSAQLPSIEADIQNLKLEIEGYEYDLSILNQLYDAADIASNVITIPLPHTRIFGGFSVVAKVIFIAKIHETEAAMREKNAELKELEEIQRILLRDNERLRVKFKFSEQAYEQCMGS